MASFKDQWIQRARQLKTEVYALYLAYRDPRVPLYARIFAAVVVAYAFSPIDLIPDPIPILGYLDDLVLVPLGVALALRMVPGEVMAESREKAREIIHQGKPVNRTAAIVIIAIWLLCAVLVILWISKFGMEILGLSGICRGRGHMWGLFAGEARKQPPHFPFSTAIPKDPILAPLWG